MKDYYISLANLQKTLAQAYHTKNTSKDESEVKKAIETIERIERVIIHLAEITKKTKELLKR